MEKRHLQRRRSSIKTIVLKQICCFCLDMRIGCIIISIVNLLEGVYTFLIESWTWNIILAAVASTITGILLLYAAGRNDKMTTILSIISSMVATLLFGVTGILIFLDNHKNKGTEDNGTYEFDVKKELIAVLFTIMTMTQFYFLYCIIKFLKELKQGVYNV